MAYDRQGTPTRCELIAYSTRCLTKNLLHAANQPPIVRDMKITRGQDPTATFSVWVRSGDTVEELRGAIKAKRPDMFHDIPAANIALYPVPNLTFDDLAAGRIESQESLPGLAKLSEIFSQPLLGRLHVIVGHPFRGVSAPQSCSQHV